MNNKKGLGKGLAALMGEAKLHYSTSSEFCYIDVNKIKPHPDQPRKHIAIEALNELAQSIKENGILQPILVQKIASNGYRIIAGERRWRASQIAGLTEMPAMVKSYNDSIEFEVALIENIQRQNLNPIEEAAGYARLIEEFGYTQEHIAKSLGKSRSHIANILRLNALPQPVRDKVIDKQISMGHAKVLVGLDKAEEVAKIIIEKGLSVRQTENYVKKFYKQPQKLNSTRQRRIKNDNNDPEIARLEDTLSDKLGTKVLLQSGEGGGKITIFFEDFNALDEILAKIG
jgi:ParB family chromosome partitioning protein